MLEKIIELTNEWIRIHDIIQFVNTFYGMSYAENSRETFRKQALHRFRTAALIEDNGKATNCHIDLSDFSSAALSLVAVATATPHSSALHMKKSSYVNIAET